MKINKESIVYKKINELHLNERNPRKNDEAVATVAKCKNMGLLIESY